MKNKNNKWTEVGRIPVDAGLINIGDPCYATEDGRSLVGKSWDRFCEWIHRHEFEGVTVGPFDVTVSSGYGDGEYPVEVVRTSEGRVAAVRVIFIPEEVTL